MRDMLKGSLIGPPDVPNRPAIVQRGDYVDAIFEPPSGSSSVGDIARLAIERMIGRLPRGFHEPLGRVRSSMYEWIDRGNRNPTPGTGQDALQWFQTLPRSSYFGAGLPYNYTYFLEQPPQLEVYHAVPTEGIQGTGVPIGADGTGTTHDGGPLHGANYPMTADYDSDETGWDYYGRENWR